MRNTGKRFAAAWRFLTIFPLPGLRPGPDEGGHLRASAGMFPVVGLVIGAAAAGLTALIGTVLPPLVTAALAVGFLAWPSGALHLDGLADSADGLFSPGRDREKALAFMRDSRIGAHGAVSLVILLLMKYACLASLPAAAAVSAVVIAAAAGRAAMLFPMTLLPYAREKGLGGLFAAGSAPAAIGRACLWTGGSMLLLWGIDGMLAGLALWAACSLCWTAFLRRRLGGATGDSYGAACEIGETAALLAAAVLFADTPGW